MRLPAGAGTRDVLALGHAHGERELRAAVPGAPGARFPAHRTLRLAGTPPLRAVIERELQPGPDTTSDESLIADIRQRAGTVFHPVSTARMAAAAAAGAVDAQLRVHGVGALRIADASVFPFVTSGNTNLPTMMVAEKAADLIAGRNPPPAEES